MRASTNLPLNDYVKRNPIEPAYTYAIVSAIVTYVAVFIILFTGLNHV